jgi:uncharacterized YkwD family protein/spore coat assembly protein SafA
MKAMKFLFIFLVAMIFIAFPTNQNLVASAASIDKSYVIDTSDSQAAQASTVYTVRSGDSLWKIAVKYEVGLKELITANPQISNPALIYVGQKVTIPSAAPLKSIEDEVLRLINVERSKNGLQTLSYNWEASRVARIKSQDMINNNYFSHTSPIYGSPFKMLESYGLRFSAAAENIAYGQRSAQEVVNSWMNSPGHRANILSRSYTHTGVGVAKKANGTLYFTQVFLKPNR